MTTEATPPPADPGSDLSERDLRSAYARLARAYDTLEERIEADLRYRLDASEASLLRSRQRVDDLKARLRAEKRLGEQHARAQRQLDILTASTSWRITAPLRACARLLKSGRQTFNSRKAGPPND